VNKSIAYNKSTTFLRNLGVVYLEINNLPV